MKEQAAKKIEFKEENRIEKPKPTTKKTNIKNIGLKGFTAFKIHAGKHIP